MSELPEITAAKTMAATLKLPVAYKEDEEICLSVGRDTTLTIKRPDGIIRTGDGWTVQIEFRVPDGRLRKSADALGPQLAMALANVASVLLGNAAE